MTLFPRASQAIVLAVAVGFCVASWAQDVSANQETAMSDHFDLIVVGIGSGGFGAALAGARQGLSVLCLEKADRIGGNAVRSGVTMWESGVGGTGFPFEIYKRLKKTPGAVGVYSFGRHSMWSGRESFPGGEHVIDASRRYIDTLRRHPFPGKPSDEAFRREHMHGIVFEPDAYEGVLREMLAETGRVRVWTETTFDIVDVKDGRITGMTLTNGKRVTADAYIDGTGGGALCRAAGCEMMYGQESRDQFNEPNAAEKPNERINGVTLIFRVGKTDTPGVDPLPDGIPAECWWGRFPAVSAVRYPNGDYNCNMLPTIVGSHFAKMGYEKAYEECQRRIRAFWHYMQTGWPEFQAYRVKWVAPALGVRETTRVLGEYVLCQSDLSDGLSKQQHADIIAIADHPTDRHGAGGGIGEMAGPYGVPYRCLIPKGFKNLLIACRGSSFSSLAASSCRLSRTMMQLGQAAGTAAGLASQHSVDLPEVPPEKLRPSLANQHVELTWPRSSEMEAYLRDE
jgi:hypothetical protein